MRVLLTLVSSTLLGMVAAQAPPASPAGESASSFSAEEANVLAFLADWDRAGGEPQRVRRELPGYTLVLASFTGDAVTLGPSDGAAGEADLLVYVVPQRVGASRRLFCRRGDGAIAWTDNTSGTAQVEGRTLAADDVLAEGGKTTQLDFPRSPSRGRDGNLWLPGDLVKRATLRIRVLDESGAPAGRVTVSTVPAEDPQAAQDSPLPAGTTTTFVEGDGAIVGVPARGLAFTVTIDGVTLTLAKADARLDGATARLTLTRSTVFRARAHRNESAAIATLKNISSAQAQCQASGAIDANKNGSGEYGTFAELAGVVTVRGGTAKIRPPVLSTAFGLVEDGMIVRSGYCFRMFLPGKDATAVPELPAGGADAARVDAAQAETLWCAYAWPLEAGVTGTRAFFTDQSGDVYGVHDVDGRYSGKTKPPAPDAARAAATEGRMNDKDAANAKGRDGRTWVVIG